MNSNIVNEKLLENCFYDYKEDIRIRLLDAGYSGDKKIDIVTYQYEEMLETNNEIKTELDYEKILQFKEKSNYNLFSRLNNNEIKLKIKNNENQKVEVNLITVDTNKFLYEGYIKRELFFKMIFQKKIKERENEKVTEEIENKENEDNLMSDKNDKIIGNLQVNKEISKIEADLGNKNFVSPDNKKVADNKQKDYCLKFSFENYKEKIVFDDKFYANSKLKINEISILLLNEKLQINFFENKNQDNRNNNVKYKKNQTNEIEFLNIIESHLNIINQSFYDLKNFFHEYSKGCSDIINLGCNFYLIFNYYKVLGEKIKDSIKGFDDILLLNNRLIDKIKNGERKKCLIYFISELFSLPGKIFIKRIIPNFEILPVSYSIYLLIEKEFKKSDFLQNIENNNIENNEEIEKSKKVLDIIRLLYNLKAQETSYPFRNFIENFFMKNYLNIDLNLLKNNFIFSKNSFKLN